MSGHSVKPTGTACRYHTESNQTLRSEVIACLVHPTNQTSLSGRLGPGLIPASSRVWVYHDVTLQETSVQKHAGINVTV